jgi:ubiquinone/menaquinone biosynthesis C-methylase UbiE
MAGQIRSILLEQAKDYQEFVFHVTSNLNWLRYEIQTDYLVNLLPQGSKVLELGCGWGHTTAMLAIARQDIALVGTDIKKSATWKDLAELGCSFMRCDAAELPFHSEDFDAIISFGVIEHTNNEIRFLKEIHRCLKNDGYNIIFQLPNKYSLSEFAGRLMGIWHHDKRYCQGEIKDLIEKSNFELVNISLEHIIPAQVSRLNADLGKIIDKNHIYINKIDRILCNTPLTIFSQDHRINI